MLRGRQLFERSVIEEPMRGKERKQEWAGRALRLWLRPEKVSARPVVSCEANMVV